MRRMRRFLHGPGIRGGDDGADGLLVEPLEAALALEVLEVAADGAVLDETVGLRVRDEALLAQQIDTRRVDAPALALGERLLEERKIGERLHRDDALGRELLLEQRVVEPCLKVVHARLQEAVAVQAAPE